VQLRLLAGYGPVSGGYFKTSGFGPRNGEAVANSIQGRPWRANR